MPVTVGLVSAGIQGLGGLYQAATSGRKDRENELNAFAAKSPLAQRSKSLDDYYIYCEEYDILPKEPADFYKDFTNIPSELQFNRNRRK